MARLALLTGSAPFAGLPDNPAEQLLAPFDGCRIGAIEVVTQVMPVDRTRLPGVIEALVAEHRPAFVLSLGLATGAATFRLEQAALNAADFRVADNLGVVAAGEPIAPGGPEARFATWDARAIAKALLAAALPAVASWHAGTHLCNLTLYGFLGSLERHGLAAVPCGFLHLPYTTAQVARFLAEVQPDTAPLTPRELPSMPIGQQAEAVRIVLECLAAAADAEGSGDDP